MASAVVTVVVQALAMRMEGFVRRDADGGAVRDPELPAGKSGSLTTRTSDSIGIVTLPSGHGFTTSDVVDIRWADGARYGCTVTAVSGTTITLGVGTISGDILPLVTTAVIASKVIEVDPMLISANALALMAFQVKFDPAADETALSRFTLVDSEGGEFTQVLEPNEIKYYDTAGGDLSPLEGTAGGGSVSAKASNGSATNAAQLLVLWIQDATP